MMQGSLPKLIRNYTKPAGNHKKTEKQTATYWRPTGQYGMPPRSGGARTDGQVPSLQALLGNHLTSGGYMHLKTKGPYRPFPGGIPDECRDVIAPDITERPFYKLDQTKDHWCQLGFLSPCISECATAHVNKDYRQFVATVGYPWEHHKQRKIVYDGGEFYTANHIFPYDDLYCHGNKWHALDFHEVSDYHGWHAKAAAECQKLQVEFPLLKTWNADEMLKTTKSEIRMLETHLNGRGLAPTTWMMRRHAAFKCGFGDLGCDMAYCAANFCILPGKTPGKYVMGHREQCPGGMEKMLQTSRGDLVKIFQKKRTERLKKREERHNQQRVSVDQDGGQNEEDADDLGAEKAEEEEDEEEEANGEDD